MGALLGYGSELRFEDPLTPGSYILVAEVQSISGPSISRDAVESTHMQSPAGWRQFIPGLKDGGELSFDINFDPTETTHAEVSGLLSQLQSDDVHNYQLRWPDVAVSIWDMPAFMTAFEVELPLDDRITASITLKVAGEITFS